jgi:hypothetical protein
MKKKVILRKLIFLPLIFALGLISCSKNEPAIPPLSPSPSPQSTGSFPSPSPTIAAATAAVIEKPHNGLALIQSLNPRVDLRQRSESIWKETKSKTDLFRYDSIQTQEQGTAQLKFKSGATLAVSPRTLLVIDKDPIENSTEVKQDRVLVQSGKIQAETPKVMWILTPAGLIEVKANSGKSKPGRAEVDLNTAEKIKITVDAGQVHYINPNRTFGGNFEKVEIAERNVLVLPLPQKPLFDSQSLNNPTQEKNWGKLSSATATKIPSYRLEVSIATPTEGELLTSTQVELHGKVTGSGARILVNGQLTYPDRADEFSVKLTLKRGANIIVVQAIRPDNSVQFLRRSVNVSLNDGN